MHQCHSYITELNLFTIVQRFTHPFRGNFRFGVKDSDAVRGTE